MSRALFLWSPAVAQMAIIFVASSLPDLSGLPGGISDHTAHFAGYALLAALLLRATAGGRWAGVTAGAAWWAFATSAAYGVTDELHQRLVRGRSPAVDDWIADVVGAAAGVLGVWIVAARIRGRTVGRDV